MIFDTLSVPKSKKDLDTKILMLNKILKRDKLFIGRSQMKKIFILLLLVSLVVSVSGCKKTEETPGVKVISPNVETKIENYSAQTQEVSFKKVSANFYGGFITTFNFSESHKDRIYVGLKNGEIYRSDDSGKSWEKIAKITLENQCKNYAQSLEINSIAESPDGKAIFVGTESGIFKSEDDGKSFKYLSNGLPGDCYIYSIIFSKDNPNSILITTPNGNFISEDIGLTWDVFKNPEEPSSTIQYDRVNNILYASTDNKLFESTDFGLHWEKINREFNAINGFAVSQSNPSVIYVISYDKIFVSKNAGESFEELPFSNLRIMPKIVVNPKDPNFIILVPVYANTFEAAKLFISHDGGATFKEVNLYNSIEIAQFNPNGDRFFILTVSGNLFSSQDEITFKLENVFPEVYFNKIIVDNGKGFVLTNSTAFKWDLDNNTLALLNKDGFDNLVNLEICSKNLNVVYAMSYARPFKLEGDTLKSLKSQYGMRNLVVNPNEPENVVIEYGDEGSNWALISYDGGKTFKEAPNNLISFAFDSVNPEIVFAVGLENKDGITHPVLFRSHDSGKTFSKVSEDFIPRNPVSSFRIVIVDSAIYAYSVDGNLGVFKSVDGGKTFKPINNGLIYKNIKDLQFNPKTKDLFLLTPSCGLFMLKNGSDTWIDISGNLPKDKISAIAVDEATGNFFVGVDNIEIFEVVP